MPDPLLAQLRPGTAIVCCAGGVAVRGTVADGAAWARALAASGLGIKPPEAEGAFLYLRDAEVGGVKVGWWRVELAAVVGLGLVAMR